MQAFLYRWRLVPGLEDAFISAWSANTETLRGLGSFGSRLHCASDGWWYAYAQWPDVASREQAFATAPATPGYREASDAMRRAIAESSPVVVLDPRADFLVMPS